MLTAGKRTKDDDAKMQRGTIISIFLWFTGLNPVCCDAEQYLHAQEMKTTSMNLRFTSTADSRHRMDEHIQMILRSQAATLTLANRATKEV
jgi:hypothetical protein